MIIENHIKDCIYENIPKTKNAKKFLDVVRKKYTKFSKNRKNEIYDNH